MLRQLVGFALVSEGLGMKKALSVPETTEAIGIGKTKLYELFSLPEDQGGLQSIVVGRRRLVPVTALDRWIERRSGRPIGTEGEV
jgi:hypothetical protein